MLPLEGLRLNHLSRLFVQTLFLTMADPQPQWDGINGRKLKPVFRTTGQRSSPATARPPLRLQSNQHLEARNPIRAERPVPHRQGIKRSTKLGWTSTSYSRKSHFKVHWKGLRGRARGYPVHRDSLCGAILTKNLRRNLRVRDSGMETLLVRPSRYMKIQSNRSRSISEFKRPSIRYGFFSNFIDRYIPTVHHAFTCMKIR